MREAWVRPGGGASYWEVDLTTGKDLGVVLKQGPTFIKQGRLPGGGPSLSKPSSSAFNPEIKLGKRIGRGNAGDVFLDANNPDFVLKKLSTQDSVLLTEVHMKEVEYFNRYYGEGSAEFIKQGNQHYIRMYRVPGKTLIEINSKIYPPNAKERFLSMMDDLGYNNIIHNDLNFNNVLYDKKNNTFYPIDFDNAYDGYYSASDPNSGKQYWGIKMRVGFILEHIEEYALT
ncbi:OspG family effector kinase [Yersinia pekkanenii]